ncbi:Na+-transporting NADH:ubiquinone oxidoreductase subunit A [Ekhidna lutea]|uniref:Na(+)-translocating NADH-quinone reductase subunit A n=1 Tax=Ekhidna lutea TaxID=447679 RepID=A0A239L215_EKHLU|nr:Na(+)-translocating NADH-quinone reductase subunit A [Ekhidna lutea]SNT24657.1 Na+-transporting NADH:ubiquinone oxidoreductase subunit A [Ekhidna lutea]
MSQTIKLKKGFDLNLAGKAENKTIEVPKPDTYALKPTDFNGLNRPKVIVKEGDNVKAGSPLFFERNVEDILYTSPVSGEVVEIKRGEKRKVLEVKILADKEIEFEKFKKYSPSDINGISKEDALEQLKKSGGWTNVIQRPYGCVADPTDTPKAIFISTFDSSPLAPDYAFVLQGQEQYFQAGVDILKKFTAGTIHMNVDGKAEVSQLFSQTKNVQLNKVSGPHPAGNVGVQIHHLDPISKGDIVWTVNPVGVALIGKLFIEGVYDTSRLVALTGSQMKERGYAKMYAGACLNKLAENVEGTENRFVSGNVLSGEGVGAEGYLGYYHNQITVIPEGKYEEFMGWILPSTNKLSFHRAFGMLTFLNGKNKEFKVDTNTHGEERNFVVTGTFEEVMPMDILPTYLFKAILAEDYDDMEALGIYEVIEEDVALCEFVDVSKNPLQEILREGIELIKEG